MITTLINEKKAQKPHYTLNVMRVEANVWYELGFYKHHYMSETLNKCCKCLLFTLNNTPCAFVALINQPSKGYPNKMAISRIVILPEFQGLGLSSRILNFCGGIVTACGESFSLCIKTVHQKMGEGLERNKEWKPTANNGKAKKEKDLYYEGAKYKNRQSRASYCYKYCGEPLHGYSELMLPIDVLRKNKK